MSSQGRPVRHPSPPGAIVTGAGRSVSLSPQEGTSQRCTKFVRLLVPSPINDERRHTPPDPGQRSRTTSTEPCSPTSNNPTSHGQFFSSGRFYDTPRLIHSSLSISSSEPYANRDGYIKRVPSFVTPVTWTTDDPIILPSASAAVHSPPAAEVSTTPSINATRREPMPLTRNHARLFSDASVRKLRAQVGAQSLLESPVAIQKDSIGQSYRGAAPTSRKEILSVMPLATSSSLKREAPSGQAPGDVYQTQDPLGIKGGKKRRRGRSRSRSSQRMRSKRSPSWRPPTYDEGRPFKRTKRDHEAYPRSSGGGRYLGSWLPDGARDAVQSTSEGSPESQQLRGAEEEQRSFSGRGGPQRTGEELDYHRYDDRWAGGKTTRYDASSSSRSYGGRPSGTLHPDHSLSHHWDHTSAHEDYRCPSYDPYTPSSAYHSRRPTDIVEECLDRWESSWRASHSRISKNVDYEFGCGLEELQEIKSILLIGVWSKDRRRQSPSDPGVLDMNSV